MVASSLLFTTIFITPGRAYAGQFMLNGGTSVPIVVSKGENGQVSAKVQYDIAIPGVAVLIKSGTPVELSITKQDAGSPCQQGSVSVNSASTYSVDGQRIVLSGSYLSQGEDNTALCIGLTVGLFFIISLFSLFFLLIKGNDAAVGGALNGFVVSNSVMVNVAQ